jgi:hypothetical protein
MTKMAADYGIESQRLAQTIQQIVSGWIAATPASPIPEQPARH